MNVSFKKFRVTPAIHGLMVWPVNDAVIGKCLSQYGEWAEGENIVMSEFVNKGDTVIDIGANIGTTVLPMSNNVGDYGKVIAFEPQSIMSQCLNTNLTINDITNVEVYNLAISNKNGWAKLNDQKFWKTGRYGSAGISSEGTRVKTITLNDVEVDKCSLVKIDIEGHEWQAIQGGKDFLLKHKPTLYMEAKKEIKNTKKCLKWLFENHWICYWHFSWWVNEKKVAEKDNIFFGDGDMNIVAVHKNKAQPKNLLKLNDFNEEWTREKYLGFYEENSLEYF